MRNSLRWKLKSTGIKNDVKEQRMTETKIDRN